MSGLPARRGRSASVLAAAIALLALLTAPLAFAAPPPAPALAEARSTGVAKPRLLPELAAGSRAAAAPPAQSQAQLKPSPAPAPGAPQAPQARGPAPAPNPAPAQLPVSAALNLLPPAAAGNAWLRYSVFSLPTARAPLPTLVGRDAVCRCTLLSYAASACQSAAAAHCAQAASLERKAFCDGVLASNGGLESLAGDALNAAAVAGYLQQLCFPSEKGGRGSPNYCTCFTDTYSKGCAVARLGLCRGSSRNAAACTALTLGPGTADPKLITSFLSEANSTCSLNLPPPPPKEQPKADEEQLEEGDEEEEEREEEPAAAPTMVLLKGSTPRTKLPEWLPHAVYAGIAIACTLCAAGLLAACCLGCVHVRRLNARAHTRSLPRVLSDSAVYIPYCDGDDERACDKPAWADNGPDGKAARAGGPAAPPSQPPPRAPCTGGRAVAALAAERGLGLAAHRVAHAGTSDSEMSSGSGYYGVGRARPDPFEGFAVMGSRASAGAGAPGAGEAALEAASSAPSSGVRGADPERHDVLGSPQPQDQQRRQGRRQGWGQGQRAGQAQHEQRQQQRQRLEAALGYVARQPEAQQPEAQQPEAQQPEAQQPEANMQWQGRPWGA